jgi:hypothetical protein
MTKYIIRLISIMMIMVSGTARAVSFAGLEAYKLELESHIDTKIRQAVKALLVEEQYSLSVTVELKSSAEITKLLPKTGMNESDLAKDNAKASGIGAENFIFVENKPTDEEVLLPLTKLGLWQRKTVASPQDQNAGGTQAGAKKEEVPFISYRDFVSSINVNMFLDRDLSTEITEAAERVVRGALANTDGRLNVQFGKNTLPKKIDPREEERKQREALDRKERKEREEKEDKERERDRAERAAQLQSQNKEKQRSLLDYLVEFKMPIALIVCTLAMFMLGLMSISNFNQMSTRKMALMEKQGEREDAAFKAAQMREEETHSKVNSVDLDLSEKDLEIKRVEVKSKMISFVESNPREAALMIRRWVLFKGDGATEALNFLARTLSVPQMTGLLEQLSEDDRRSWNQAVSNGFGARDEKVALAFAETQLLVNIIHSNPSVDESLKNLISTLGLNEIVTVIRKNQELGAVLVLFLQSSQLAKVFESLEVEMVTRLSQIGVQVTPATIGAKMKELHELITQVKAEVGARSPFVDKLQGLLREVSPDKEGPLFFAMATKLDRKSFLEFLRTHVPADLIPRLPFDLLKKAMGSISLVRRAEMILSQSDDRREFLLSLIGEGKAREILNEEIENISLESSRVSFLKRNGETSWRQFIQIVRIQTQDEAKLGDLDEVLNGWIEGLAQKGRGNAKRAA